MPTPLTAREPLAGERLERAEANASLIWGAVDQYPDLWPGGNRDDAIGVATDAYMRAAACFRPDLGYSFSTYVYCCIRRGLVHARIRASERTRRQRRYATLMRPSLARAAASPTPRDPEVGEWLKKLTPRDRQVCELAARGHKYGDIGRTLGISKQRVCQILDRARAIHREA